MTKARILVVEDEPDLREVLKYNLTREGYRVLTAADGATGLRLAREEKPDLILLDLMLPDLDGLEVCRRLRGDQSIGGTPIIMVTAKDEEADVVLGLGLGADDYIPKPYRMKEVVARVGAVLRRGSHDADDDPRQPLRRGPVRIDPARHDVEIDGVSVAFTATEFRLLHFLASRPGRVYERDTLLRRVLGDDAIRVDRNIDVHVRSIRKKLGPHRDIIETIRGVGYRFSDRA
ncbi:MAG: response regulator transcription factor [Planctomycetota bacterium]|nr:response regulator transcription factor [Planctomycetota bacterium]